MDKRLLDDMQADRSDPNLRSEIELWFVGELEEGHDIFRRAGVGVLKRCETGCCVEACVQQGPKARAYDVLLKIDWENAVLNDVSCSCGKAPCVHAAAVAIALLVHEGQTPPIEALVPLDAPSPTVTKRVEWSLLEAARTLRLADDATSLTNAEGELYLFVLSEEENSLVVNIKRCKKKPDGTFSSGRALKPTTLRYATDDPLAAAYSDIIELLDEVSGSYSYTFREALHIEAWNGLLNRVLESGAARWETTNGPVLTLAAPRAALLQWDVDAHGNQRLSMGTADGGTELQFALPVPWYVDPRAGECGPLRSTLPANTLRVLMQMPVLLPEEAEALPMWLHKYAPQLKIPLPKAKYATELRSISPKPCLLLDSMTVKIPFNTLNGEPTTKEIDFAVLTFEYPEHVKNPLEHSRTFIEGNVQVIESCAVSEELTKIDQLLNLGFERLDPSEFGFKSAAVYVGAREPASWLQLYNSEKQLLEDGWQIKFSPVFRAIETAINSKFLTVVEGGEDWWLSLEMGVKVGADVIPLLPLLRDGIARLGPEPTINEIDQLARYGNFVAQLEDGRLIKIPFDRVRNVLEVLFDVLLDMPANKSTAKVSVAHLVQLMKDNQSSLAARGAKRLIDIAKKLASFEGMETAIPPAGFKTQLRHYQIEGLTWLQFLREYQLGGILADDMGLGKTAQVLAHLLLEKESGRLKGPSLVVCPTSLVPNWANEARRFAPELKTLPLQGSARSNDFDKIADHDIVISTYPLMLRDMRALGSVKWQAIILDEAHQIKNPQSKIAHNIFNLHAQQKLCLTGTPVQNHLGDLWSQFMFLMPGLLGTEHAFKANVRKPIEKIGDKKLLEVFAARLAPFVLRRTKEQVAPELPEKTTIIQRIELEQKQRDLYEVVRVAMKEKLRESISKNGVLDQFLILEALLKLRQICCDSRLLKGQFGAKAAGSAKLERLLDMLPELVEQGRRVLVFSQFTSMLDLITPELQRLGLKYTELRGTTTDRATPVAQFQNGDVPLFLISLKAGGTGLNLTSADTVIHYDPWWNPAVEDQATDRAHRIGQDKPVFVYKLIAAGTIEDRMLEWQIKKRELAAGIFDPQKSASIAFTEEDLDLLFLPMGSIEPKD